MNIFFDIAHPADVHTYKFVREKLLAEGHHVTFMARDKDVVLELLDVYKIPYEKGTAAGHSRIKIAFELLLWFKNAYRIIRKKQIDIAVSLSSPATAWAARLCGIPHIMFNDTETGVAQLRMARPATVKIYTPDCLLSEWGSKQVCYRAIHDLAYLQPKYFTPVRLDKPQSPYAVLRFVSWNASHDCGVRKTTVEFQKAVIKTLSKKMNVVISAEGELPPDLEPYRLTSPPDKFHDLLAFADIVVGDGASTATEAAVLGVPSVYISPFAESLGYCKLLEEYKLLISVKSEKEGLQAIEKLLTDDDSKKRKTHREKFLSDSIDLVEFMTEQIILCSKK